VEDYSEECISTLGKREEILPATGREMLSYSLPLKHGKLLLLYECLPGDSEWLQ